MSFFFDALQGNGNLAVASLPVALLFSALPHWYTIYLAESNKVQGGWTNQNPRAFVARLNAKAAATGKRLTPLEEKILRGQSAQQNGFEWWAVWAVSVAFGILAKVPKKDMDRYALLYLGLRLAYSFLYINVGSRAGSLLRTLVFQFSVVPSVLLFAKASRALA